VFSWNPVPAINARIEMTPDRVASQQ